MGGGGCYEEEKEKQGAARETGITINRHFLSTNFISVLFIITILFVVYCQNGHLFQFKL
jgi:hypothetical protein